MLEPKLSFWSIAAKTASSSTAASSTDAKRTSSARKSQFAAVGDVNVGMNEVLQLFKTVVQKCAITCARQVGVGTLGVHHQVCFY